MHVIKIRTSAAFLLCSYFFYDTRAPFWSEPPHFRGFTITHYYTHHTPLKSSGLLNSPSQRALPDKTNHLQETDIQAAGEIRTRNPTKRVAADPHIRPRDELDRRKLMYESSF